MSIMSVLSIANLTQLLASVNYRASFAEHSEQIKHVLIEVRDNVHSTSCFSGSDTTITSGNDA